MKKVIVLILCAALVSGWTGCSSDDDASPSADDMMPVQKVKIDGNLFILDSDTIPYQPTTVSTLPKWLQSMIAEGQKSTQVIVRSGEWNGEQVYNVWSRFSQTVVGYFYSPDGKAVNDRSIANGVQWICIYYWEDPNIPKGD